MNRTEKAFEIACEIYSDYGVDSQRAIETLAEIPIAIHAWQDDDVTGFENMGNSLTGGCQVTGNYPGRARNSTELRMDLDMTLKLISGTSRICLQGHQVDKMFPRIDRDEFSIDNFHDWLSWAKAKGLGLDIAPAFYSHPKLDHGLSLSHPDQDIRRFWIEHGKAIRRIGAEFGNVLGTPAICNFWVPDGYKDTPVDRLAPRLRLIESLDHIFEENIDETYELDAVESKLFGIGVESYTVGSNDFYLMYAARCGKLICFDSGHFHPTESIADKLTAIVAQQGRILLHVSRGVHWDSDHVIVLNDELLNIGRETIFCADRKSIYICLDYFDASINRIAAWVVGVRNMLKSLLIGLLEPSSHLCALENTWDFSGRLSLQEEAKSLPWGDVWRYFCETQEVPLDFHVMNEIRNYEDTVLCGRT